MFCVNVLDVNDVEPMFEQEIYEVKLPENTSVGSYFIKLKAFDFEEGLNYIFFVLVVTVDLGIVKIIKTKRRKKNVFNNF